MNYDILVIQEHDDNVAVALRNITAGEILVFQVQGTVQKLHALQDIPIYHKISLIPLEQAAPVIKYGETIGYASCPIPAGCHVHDHNMSSFLITKN